MSKSEKIKKWLIFSLEFIGILLGILVCLLALDAFIGTSTVPEIINSWIFLLIQNFD